MVADPGGESRANTCQRPFSREKIFRYQTFLPGARPTPEAKVAPAGQPLSSFIRGGHIKVASILTRLA